MTHSDPGGEDDPWADEGGKGLFDSPRRSSDRSPPFSININFDQYRRNREYTVKIEAFEYYDSFLLQARGRDQADGNATLVGWFVKIPQISKDIKCFKKGINKEARFVCIIGSIKIWNFFQINFRRL